MHERGKAPFYELQILVKEEHIDTLKHVNNIMYIQWVQDTAGAHWKHTASEEEQQQYRWVVLRHEVDYLKPAFKGEQLTGHTWVEKMEGVKSFRHVEIRRGAEVLVKAVTTWVMINAENGRPTRVPKEMAKKFL